MKISKIFLLTLCFLNTQVLHSEVCEEPTCEPCQEKFWLTGNYLLAWIKDGPLSTPLVTTGSSTESINAGVLGKPNTRILFGGDLDFDAFSGVSIEAGLFLDPCNRFSLSVNGLWLSPEHVRFAVASDSDGNPVIARPFFNVAPLFQEDALQVAFPGKVFGHVDIDAKSELWGAGFDAAYHFTCGCLPAELSIGFRYLSLQENLEINDQSTTIAPLPLVTIMAEDQFDTHNQFYGVQFGGRLNWERNCFFANLFGKLAIGGTKENVKIKGSSTLIASGETRTAEGGVLALSSNIGDYSQSVFGIIPEVGINLGYKATNHIHLLAGYSFLYWNKVARPGAQIDREVNTNLLPFSGVPPIGPQEPDFSFQEDSFWVQALNFGIRIQY